MRSQRRSFVPFGSVAPLRFVDQLTFDQLFMCLASPIFERWLWILRHCACADERRLLCLKTGHCQRDFLWGWMAGVGLPLKNSMVGRGLEVCARRPATGVRA